ncbi:MAG: PAS domain S-box protein [Spirochaetota bacterium]
MKKPVFSPDEGRSRSIFEHVAVPLWEEDISELRSVMKAMKSRGTVDLRKYLDDHPGFIAEAAGMIKVVDVNDAALQLYEVKSKEELLGNLDKTLDLHDPATFASIKSEIISIAEGVKHREEESIAITPSGKKLTVLIKSSIPAENDEYTTMLVSVIDITEQKRFEKALEQERAYLTTLIDNLPDFIYFKDRSGRFIIANRACSQLFGEGDPKNLIGKTDRDFFPKELADKFMADEQKVMQTAQGMISIEEPSVSSSGSWAWVSTTKMPVFDREGNISGIVGIGRDITERKLAEAEVERLRKQIEFILGATKTGLDIIDSKYTLRYVDPEWQKVYGDPQGRKCYEYFMGRAHACAGCGAARAFATKRTVVSEELLVREGNRPVQVTTIPFQDENGEWLVAEVNVDISERKRMEESNVRLATLVESAHEAIMEISREGIITIWNKGAEKVYGYSAGEIIGRPISVMIPPGVSDEFQRIMEKLIHGERIEEHETLRKRKDGEIISVSVTYSPIKDAEGRITGIAAIGRDITEQKAVRAQLLRAQRLESLGTLARGIAHQFNNINTAVMGYLDILLRAGNLQASSETLVRKIQKGVQRAVDITERLLGLTGTAEPGKKSVRLDDLARSLLPLYEKMFEAENVSLRFELSEIPPVKADRSQLEFLLTSLLSNALHSLIDQPSRFVTVRTGSEEGFAFLEVSDSGCGIPPEDLPRLFTPFFTTKGEWASAGSPQAKVKGVGLSLAVCQSTVAEYGGRIEVKSRPGTGSTFRVWLPAEQAVTG